LRIGSRAQSQERIVNCHLSQATLWRVRARAAKPWRNAAGWCGAQAQPRMAPAAPVRIHLVRCGGSIAFQKPGLNRVTGPVMFIRSATRPGGAPVGVRFPDERSDFPHKRIFFPAPLKKFPVWWVQGIGSRDPRNVWCFGLWKRGSARNREIPCIFPWNREFGVGETGSLETAPSATPPTRATEQTAASPPYCRAVRIRVFRRHNLAADHWLQLGACFIFEAS